MARFPVDAPVSRVIRAFEHLRDLSAEGLLLCRPSGENLLWVESKGHTHGIRMGSPEGIEEPA